MPAKGITRKRQVHNKFMHIESNRLLQIFFIPMNNPIMEQIFDQYF